jgi:CrcB protein
VKDLILVFFGGGIGSMLRFAISKYRLRIIENSFPLGTIVANLLSCFILSMVLVWLNGKEEPLIDTVKVFLLVGFCGGLSTFSTFSFETVELVKQGFWGIAMLNILLSLVLGVSIIFAIIGNQSST